MPSTSLVDKYIDVIAKEFELRNTETPPPYSTIYIGGGTPSILTAEQIARLISYIPLSDDLTEFTIEVNPEDVTEEKIELYRALGINRVSMGAQSFIDNELKIIGRRHSADSVLEAVETIRKGGIDNFSIDLIYGLPAQTLESWNKSLAVLYEINPTHFSAYMLTYEPRTRLTAMLRRGDITEASDDMIVDMYQALITGAKAHGYDHYEISNFSLPGFAAKHNSSYWDFTPYLGLGPSAHSFDGKLRRINPSNLKSYISALESGVTACEIDEESKLNQTNDLIITALRTSRGLDLGKVKLRYRVKLLNDIFPHLKSGNIITVGNNFVIPEDRWIISDSILSDVVQV